MERDNKLDLEKLKIADRLKRIEDFLIKQHVHLYGDPTTNPPIKGYESRLKDVEEWKEGHIRAKREMLKMAAGSMTIAVGGAIIWLFNVIRTAFIDKGHV